MALVWRYFETSREREIARSCPSTLITSSNSEVRSAIFFQTTAKQVEQKALIGKTAAEHDVVANLCIGIFRGGGGGGGSNIFVDTPFVVIRGKKFMVGSGLNHTPRALT